MMKPIFEYLLSKSNAKDIKQSYYDFFKDNVLNEKNCNDVIEKMMADLDKMPNDYKEALFEILCKLYDEDYIFEPNIIGTLIKSDDKIVRMLFQTGQTSFMIFNMPKKRFSAIFVWPKEMEIDWYLYKNADINLISRGYSMGIYPSLTGNEHFRDSWLFREKSKIDEFKNIITEIL